MSYISVNRRLCLCNNFIKSWKSMFNEEIDKYYNEYNISKNETNYIEETVIPQIVYIIFNIKKFKLSS